MIDGMILELLASKATGTTHSDNTLKQKTWVDLKSTYNGSLINFNFTNTSGWIGTGSYSDPYRLAFDGINDYVSLPYTMDYDKDFSIETRIKVPISGTGQHTIFCTEANVPGAWIIGVAVNLDTKKIALTFGYHGIPGSTISSADNIFNLGDILDLAIIYKVNRHVEVWCNGIKVIDNVFNERPSKKPQLCLGAVLPTFSYLFYKVEIISFRIFDRVLTSNEIIYLYGDIKYLIKQDSYYYSINPENYNYDIKTFTPLTLSGISSPNTEDIETYGFYDISKLTTDLTIGSETFKPIDKLFSNFEIKGYKVK